MGTNVHRVARDDHDDKRDTGCSSHACRCQSNLRKTFLRTQAFQVLQANQTDAVNPKTTKPCREYGAKLENQKKIHIPGKANVRLNDRES